MLFRHHLAGHGQSYFQHLVNNLRFSWLAVKSALYTMGHGVFPPISGRKASEIHNQLWNEGRSLSVQDLQHRLANGWYKNQQAALDDFYDYQSLYSEAPVLSPYESEIRSHYEKPAGNV